MSFTPPARQRSKRSKRDLSPARILKFADEQWVEFPDVKPGGYSLPLGPIAPLPSPFPATAPTPLPPLDPPVRPFTATPPTSPPPTLKWFNAMFADLEREHAQVQELSKGCTETVGGTHRQSGTALAEFAQESKEMQIFLDMVGATAGRRVVKEILEGVEEHVDGWFHGTQEGEEEGEEGDNTGPS